MRFKTRHSQEGFLGSIVALATMLLTTPSMGDPPKPAANSIPASMFHSPQPEYPNVFGLHDLTAYKLDGTAVDIAAQTGWKVIYFWSDACPCVTACEQYSFLPLAKKYEGKVQFFAVVSGQYDLKMQRTALTSHISDHHLSYSVLLDPQHTVVTALGAMVTPQTFLLDPQNRVVFSGMPDDSRRYLYKTGKHGVTESYLGQALIQAFAGKPITQPHTENQGCIIAW
jgi:peroxiredoxin